MQFSFRSVRQGVNSITVTEHSSINKIHNLLRGNQTCHGVPPKLEQTILSKVSQFSSAEDMILVPANRGLIIYTPTEADLGFRKPQNQQIAGQPFKNETQRNNGILSKYKNLCHFTGQEADYIIHFVDEMIDDLELMIREIKSNATIMQEYNKQGIDRATIDQITKFISLSVAYKLLNGLNPSKFALWARTQKGTFISLVDSEPSSACYYEIAVKKRIIGEFWQAEEVNGYQLVKSVPRVIMTVADILPMYGCIYIRKAIQSFNLVTANIKLLNELKDVNITMSKNKIPSITVQSAKSSSEETDEELESELK